MAEPPQHRSPVRRLLALQAAAVLLAGSAAWFVHGRGDWSAWQQAAVAAAVAALMMGACALAIRRLLRPLRDLAANQRRTREQLDRQTAALQESESRYRGIFDAMRDGLLLVDQDGVIVAVNAGLTGTHGWTSRQLCGRPVTCLLRDEDADLARSLRIPPADHPLRSVGMTRDREGRERETEIAAVRLTYQGRPHALVVLRDVATLRRLERQLLLTQKYETVGHLAGGVAHDFNNLLTPVLGYSEMLLAQPGLDAEAREDLLAIQRAGERARSLARRLLAYSRRRPPAVQELELGRTLAGCASLLRQTLPEDVELRIAEPDEPHPVLADAGQVEQVLMNLAVNAMDAMPDGGVLEIELTARASPVAGRQDTASAAFSCLRVSDTGPGIPEEILDRVCEPLFTTKSPDQGTGMGLTTVQSIVEQHGGSLAIRNRPGGGCEVEVLLPRLQASSAEAGAGDRAEPGVPRRGRGETVILVEDDAMVRRLVETLLVKYGYRVRSYACGADCLADLEAAPAPADLLLSDVVMPGMSGPELRDRLHAAGRVLPTLFMSGYSGETLLRRGLAGVRGGDRSDGFLQKPLTPEQLLAELHRMFARTAGRSAG